MEDLNEVEEVFWAGIANVVDFVRWKRKAVFASLFGWGFGHDANDAFDDVVDVSEVALAVTVVEDFDGLALDELIGEAEVGHVGAAGGAVDGEETEAGGGDVVKFGVGVSEEFVALFGGGVEGDGIIDFVVGAEGDFGIAAVDGAAGGVDEVFGGVVAAGFEDVVEADEVGFDVGVGVVDAVANASLGGEVDDNVGLVLGKQLVDGGLISEVTFDESEVFEDFELVEAGSFEIGVVVRVEAVETDDFSVWIFCAEALGEVAADEAGRASDEDGFVVEEIGG